MSKTNSALTNNGLDPQRRNPDIASFILVAYGKAAFFFNAAFPDQLQAKKVIITPNQKFKGTAFYTERLWATRLGKRC